MTDRPTLSATLRRMAETEDFYGHDAEAETLREAADALEQAIEPLVKAGDPEVAEEFRLAADYVLMTREWWEHENLIHRTRLEQVKAERQRAIERPGAGTGWQPIETAPTSGRRVMLWAKEWSGPASGQFDGTGWGPLHPERYRYQPTYWMPLPAPPTEASGEPPAREPR